MKKKISIVAITLEFAVFGASSLWAKPMDTSAWWLVASPKSDNRTQNYLDSLVELLDERGRVPLEQISRLQGEKCTRDGVEAAIEKIGGGMNKGDRLIFLYHGFVTKPQRLNAVYFLTHGATPDSYKNGFEIRQLNGWIRALTSASMFAVIDGYTNDQNLMAFYANRESPGDAAYVSIQPAAENASHELSEHFLAVLQKDTADLDENRQISIGELHEFITTNAPPQPGILAPTGNIEATILKLSPMLSIVTVPGDASITLNGVQTGQTPYHLVDSLVGGIYTVEVRKPGYLIPPPQTKVVDLAQGQATRLSWDLESIAIFGDVKTSDGAALGETKVWVDETEYEQRKHTIGANQRFRILANATTAFRDKSVDTQMLEPNQTYTLRAESGSLYHAETAFTLPEYESLRQDLTLEQKTWFEVAQIRFNRGEDAESIEAFLNGIEETTEFPAFTQAFTQTLFNWFSTTVDKESHGFNATYVVAAAQLAEQLNLRKQSKNYWIRVKAITTKGTREHVLATERLRNLNMARYLINVGIILVLLVVLISAVFTMYRHRRKTRNG